MAVNCDPAALATAAKCFECVPRPLQKPLELYLLAVIAGGSTDPATLVRNAKCFCEIPHEMHAAVEAYLLCQIVNK